MATQVQFRGGTTVEHSTFTGAAREITVDIDKDTVVVHDGATAGGHPLAKEDGSVFTNVDINSGTIDGTTIGASTPAVGNFTNVTVTGTVDGRDVAADGTKLDGIEAGADVTDTANVTAAGAAMTTGATMAGNLNFNDGIKAQFGASADLQIYHDGSNSAINEVGTGSLYLQATNLFLRDYATSQEYLTGVSGGAVTLHHSGNQKLATTSTGVDVTGQLVADSGQFDGNVNIDGTITSDGLTVDQGGTATINITSGAGSWGMLAFGDPDDADAGRFFYDHGINALTTRTAATNRMQIAGNGDISFYEDTGTTPKFFWDASAERLGIGTSSPARDVHISTTSGYAELRLDGASGSGGSVEFYSNGTAKADTYADASGNLYFRSNTGVAAKTMVLDSSGNVGIGTSSPSRQLHVSGSGVSTRLRVENTTGSNVLDVYAEDSGNSTLNYSSVLTMSQSGAERMRIDASGNLLVGMSTASATADGFYFDQSGFMAVSRSRPTANTSLVAQFNRKTTDGDIVQFHKDGTTVGSIGTKARTSQGRIFVGNSNTRLLFDNGVDAIIPANNDGNDRDNAIDLGASGARFDDIYATNALIQTSDRNEKQDIAELDEAERRVAVAAKGLLRKFRWKSAVEEKGDDARIHFGIIAQDLQAAFEAEGLDAGRYAMFIHSTWTDEETGEERSRMGVRYSELLAFIIAAI